MVAGYVSPRRQSIEVPILDALPEAHIRIDKHRGTVGLFGDDLRDVVIQLKAPLELDELRTA